MICVKLFVILTLVIAEAKSSEYCKICPNHTLCKYPIPGPSFACEGYNVSALLKRTDIIDILNRINERRNFVALGLSKRFPTAANMRTITWSEDLAWSAQRWVDQCDPDVRPDKHDLCRNLEDKAVGQNIATIFGPSPGLSVKSFVDVWFMQSIDYYGEISFYNRSQDEKTNDFTQLVWAETDIVGCGRAKFVLKHKLVIERLVCNFAPAGNVNGKPVYALGIAATQCSDGCDANHVFTGLCSCQPQSRKITVGSLPVTSLLRILNLANSSVKQDIDPLKHKLKQSSTDDDDDEYHRHHKSRHVVNNNSQAEMSHLIHGVPMMNNLNDSRNFLQQFYQPDKVHGGVYHGHRNNFIPPYYTSPTVENFRRFGLLTQPFTPLNDLQATTNYRRHFNQCNQCTRHAPVMVNCNSPLPCITDRCTRGQNIGCRVTRPCLPLVQYPHVQPHDKCGCSSSTVCPPPASSSCCETTCRCPCHATAASPCCPNIGRRMDDTVTKGDTRQSSELHYYDLFPNLARRSGDLTSENSLNKDAISTSKRIRLLRNRPNINKKRMIYKRKEKPDFKNYKEITMNIELPHYVDEEIDYSYSTFNSRKRHNRETFWQLNENKNQMILKSLQYTTLINHKNRKTWKTTHNSLNDETSTEPITIELKSFEEENEHNQIQYNKEKFLSFKELMRLRKINSEELNARRNNAKKKQQVLPPKSPPNSPPTPSTTTTKKATTTTATSKSATTVTIITPKGNPPQNYSINTPFHRKKYCTRRLTCTWTVFTATASDGSILNPGIAAQGGGGSRTPPGYVEGCTRTSTCTRDFMNRNKISTLPMTTLFPGQETLEDEDYCERRSLDVQRDDFNEHSDRIVKRQEPYKNINEKKTILHYTKKEEDKSYTAEDTRCKRNLDDILRCDHCTLKNKEGPYANPLMSYGDLYYLVLNKLTKSSTMDKTSNMCRKCPCNAGTFDTSKHSSKFVWILVIFKNIFIGYVVGQFNPYVE